MSTPSISYADHPLPRPLHSRRSLRVATALPSRFPFPATSISSFSVHTPPLAHLGGAWRFSSATSVFGSTDASSEARHTHVFHHWHNRVIGPEDPVLPSDASSHEIKLFRLVNNGFANEAMQMFSLRPGGTTVEYNIMLLTCFLRPQIDTAQMLVTEMEREGVPLNEVTRMLLLMIAARAGETVLAIDLLEQVAAYRPRFPDTVLRELLDAMFRANDGEGLFSVIRVMRRSEAPLSNDVAFRRLARWLHTSPTDISLRRAWLGLGAKIDPLGLPPNDLRVLEDVTRLCKEGFVEEAASELEQYRASGEMAEGNVRRSYTSLVSGSSSYDMARTFFEKACESSLPDTVLYTALLDVRARTGGTLDEMKGLLNEMKSYNVSPDEEVYHRVLRFCCESSDVGGAQEVRRMMRESGIPASGWEYVLLLDLHAYLGNVDAADATYREMLVQGIAPDERHFRALLSSCAVPLSSGSAATAGLGAEVPGGWEELAPGEELPRFNKVSWIRSRKRVPCRLDTRLWEFLEDAIEWRVDVTGPSVVQLFHVFRVTNESRMAEKVMERLRQAHRRARADLSVPFYSVAVDPSIYVSYLMAIRGARRTPVHVKKLIDDAHTFGFAQNRSAMTMVFNTALGSTRTLNQALYIYERMRTHGVPADDWTMNTLLSRCTSRNVSVILDIMAKAGLEPTKPRDLALLLNVYARGRVDLERVWEIYDRMQRSGELFKLVTECVLRAMRLGSDFSRTKEVLADAVGLHAVKPKALMAFFAAANAEAPEVVPYIREYFESKGQEGRLWNEFGGDWELFCSTARQYGMKEGVKERLKQKEFR